jgi:hypothetical protein
LKEPISADVDFIPGHAKIGRGFFAIMINVVSNTVRKWIRSFIFMHLHIDNFIPGLEVMYLYYYRQVIAVVLLGNCTPSSRGSSKLRSTSPTSAVSRRDNLNKPVTNPSAYHSTQKSRKALYRQCLLLPSAHSPRSKPGSPSLEITAAELHVNVSAI